MADLVVSQFRVQAMPISDIFPRWSTWDSLGDACAHAQTFEGVEGWHHVQIRDHNGNIVWDRDVDGFASLGEENE